VKKSAPNGEARYPGILFTKHIFKIEFSEKKKEDIYLKNKM